MSVMRAHASVIVSAARRRYCYSDIIVHCHMMRDCHWQASQKERLRGTLRRRAPPRFATRFDATAMTKMSVDMNAIRGYANGSALPRQFAMAMLLFAPFFR